MSKNFLFLLYFFCTLIATDTSIVFIHIGNQLPSYLPIALKQAQLFNPKVPIVLLANQKALSNSSISQEYICIALETLMMNAEHQYFRNQNKLGDSLAGFWRFTTVRFYYLYDWMNQYNIQHVFHLEYDNMLYADIAELLPLFDQHYHDCIGATFDNDERCIAGFIYIPNKTIMKELIVFMNQNLEKPINDMYMLGLFKNQKPKYIKNLPIIPKEYADDYQLVSPSGHRVKNKQEYYSNYDLFGAVFDAAALGQYLGGIDPRNGPSKPGFINESCIFNPQYFNYEWIKDEQGRKVPYLVYNDKKYKIVNLHIHAKKLIDFFSISN